eukprot:CAMPEP_0196197026 /NCGR_PEP_ID=MMETSP0912-20130531/1644_1 /TAXON_ID=49265 /ORGANISM="Thalassiosira rotula, Strain GSO102" /LENGTH=45 /DNA_ID= /DNA_START= /DNA_END= /DNA_ORIENTATION=
MSIRRRATVGLAALATLAPALATLGTAAAGSNIASSSALATSITT